MLLQRQSLRAQQPSADAFCHSTANPSPATDLFSHTSCTSWPLGLPCCDVIILRHGLAHEVTVTHIAGLEVHLVRVQGLHQLQAGDMAELAGAPHRHRVGVVSPFSVHVPGWWPLRTAASPNRGCVTSLQPGTGLAVAPRERRGAVGEAGHASRVGIIAVVTSHLQGAAERVDSPDLVLSPATLCPVHSLGCPSVGPSKYMFLCYRVSQAVKGTMILLGTQRTDPSVSLSCECGQCLILFWGHFLVNSPKKESNLAGPLFPISETG